MMSRTAATQLARRGLTVVMASDFGMTEKADEEHLAYATEVGLVMVTFDRPFAGRTLRSSDHAGLICLSGSQDDIGMIVRTLTDFVENHAQEDVAGHVFWL